jgi:hypothetical protein
MLQSSRSSLFRIWCKGSILSCERGVTVTVKVAHVRLCHSRMLFVRA